MSPSFPLGLVLAVVAGLPVPVQCAPTGSLPAGAGDRANWRHFLGPNYDGVPLVTRFSPTGIKVQWSVDLGPGCSSVAVVDGKLYTMGNRDDQDLVYCLDAATGKEVWQFRYPCEKMAKLFEGGPTSTPTVADDRVYTLSRKGQVHCLDAQTGKKIWDASGEKWTPRGGWWGFSSSPLVWGDKVFLNLTNTCLALDRATGKTLWSGDQAVPCYATLLPLPAGNPLTKQATIITQSCKGIDFVRPATGKSILTGTGWTRRSANCNAITPRVYGNSLLIMHAGAGLSKVTERNGTWVEDWLCRELQYDKGGWFTFNNQVVVGKRLYAVAGAGRERGARLACVDLDTGKVLWTRPEQFGNLLLAADKLVLVTELGEIAWGTLTDGRYDESFRKKLLNGGKGPDKDGPYWSHPVLHDNRLYVRSNGGKLSCLQFE